MKHAFRKHLEKSILHKSQNLKQKPSNKVPANVEDVQTFKEQREMNKFRNMLITDNLLPQHLDNYYTLLRTSSSPNWIQFENTILKDTMVLTKKEDLFILSR
uniref:Uncharacterized protein n=1 Tax=Physcomitrium patens TaxID=3218 RepID=A0A7I4D9M1_PHYPA